MTKKCHLLIGNYSSSIDTTWYKNDGIVNSVSMSHPFGSDNIPFDGNPIKGKWQYEKNQVTDKDNSFISEEITRNSLLRNLNNEIPYSVKIINHKWKLLRNNIIIINQNILINKLNYKKIIIGKNGTMIEKIRKFSEKKLTKVFQKKVFLHLKIIFEK